MNAPTAVQATAREKHLLWCKTRALEYVEQGDLTQAFASFISDLQKNPETKGHMAIQLGDAMFFAGLLSTAREMKEFILGTN